MAKRDPRPLEKVAVRLFMGDKDELQRLYPKAGYNMAIREIVHQHVRQRATPSTPMDLNIEELL